MARWGHAQCALSFFIYLFSSLYIPQKKKKAYLSRMLIPITLFYSCNNPLSVDTEHRLHQKHAMRGTPSVGWPSERTTVCVYCQAPLPRCVICLLHVDPHRPPVDDGERPGHVTDTIDSAYVFCLTCRHGGHANHILPWFEGGLDGGIAHSVCAVADCDCECANI